MKVKEVMSKELIVTHVPGTREDALKALAENNVSGMPVLKQGTKKVVGVITRSDIFKNPDEEQIALIMTNDPYVVEQDQEVKDAAKLLHKHQIHGLPVVNKKEELVGIISPSDILRVIAKEIDLSVEEFMSEHVAPVYEDTPVPIVLEIINITNSNALPVLDDNAKLSGIVSDGDLFKLSHIREGVSRSDLGMGGDEDEWTWEGIRDVIRLYYATSEIDLPAVPVKEIMISEVISFFRKTPVSEVAEKMYKQKISQVPLVDSNDKLVGMTTDIDILPCIFKSC